MDIMKDKLVEYQQAHKTIVQALKYLNVMNFNEPYRSYFQAFGKELATHGIILNAVLGVEQPPPMMFMNYGGQTNTRADEEIGVRTPIPQYLEQFNNGSDYTEDRDE